MSHLPFVQNSPQLIVGQIYDLKEDGTKDPVDLTGATVTIRFTIDGGASFDKSATPDPDQNANKGKITLQLTSTDIPGGSMVETQALVTQASLTHPSLTEARDVHASLAPPP